MCSVTREDRISNRRIRETVEVVQVDLLELLPGENKKFWSTTLSHRKVILVDQCMGWKTENTLTLKTGQHRDEAEYWVGIATDHTCIRVRGGVVIELCILHNAVTLQHQHAVPLVIHVFAYGVERRRPPSRPLAWQALKPTPDLRMWRKELVIYQVINNLVTPKAKMTCVEAQSNSTNTHTFYPFFLSSLTCHTHKLFSVL